MVASPTAPTIETINVGAMTDEVFAAVGREQDRQRHNIELIASENYVSEHVLRAVGSVLTNKYAEGYPGKRYYGGCEFVDEVETLAIDRAKALFGVAHANVQPHSGASANQAAYLALIKPGDKILGLSLEQGGHLTHGKDVNFSGQLFEPHFYGVDEETGLIDYDAFAETARKVRPQAIIAGASAYSRIIDFARFRAVADEVGAYLFADIAHIAGLVAVGLHPTSIGHAHITMTTTHKTLRGPRGGLILSGEEFGKQIDKSVFPGQQGGPLMHVIAGKAIAFGEALAPEFKDYGHQILANAQAMAGELTARGLPIISGGTDNHLMLVNVNAIGLSGRKAERILDDCRHFRQSEHDPGRDPATNPGQRDSPRHPCDHDPRVHGRRLSHGRPPGRRDTLGAG